LLALFDMASTSKAGNEGLVRIISDLTARSRAQVRICRKIRRDHANLLKKLEASEKAMAALMKKCGTPAPRPRRKK